MDFVKSHFDKMQLWIVEHFHLHKKVPVLMNHNIWKNSMLWFNTTGTFLWRWKCSTIQSCIFSELTSFKIHTLSELPLVLACLYMSYQNKEKISVSRKVGLRGFSVLLNQETRRRILCKFYPLWWQIAKRIHFLDFMVVNVGKTHQAEN